MHGKFVIVFFLRTLFIDTPSFLALDYILPATPEITCKEYDCREKSNHLPADITVQFHVPRYYMAMT